MLKSSQMSLLLPMQHIHISITHTTRTTRSHTLTYIFILHVHTVSGTKRSCLHCVQLSFSALLVLSVFPCFVPRSSCVRLICPLGHKVMRKWRWVRGFIPER